MDVPAFDQSLRTGYEVIDDQHAWLFELAARVSRIAGACPLDDAPHGEDVDEECEPRIEDAVAEAIYGLVDYATEHFADEEAIMREAHYPAASVHASLHADLSRRLAGFVFKYMNGQGVSAEQIVNFFTEWLTSHIMQSDREFTDWLAGQSRA